MSCKSAIYTVNTGTQTVQAGGAIDLGSIIRRFGCALSLSGNGVALMAPGYYRVGISLTVAPAAAGAVTATLLQDGVAVAGAAASETAAAAGDEVALPITALVRVPCNAGGSTLTILLTGGAADIENAAVVVEKI